MLAVCLNGFYIFLTTVCLGIVLATVYAQIWSLFYKVELAANIILTLLCAVIVLAG